MLNGKNAVVTGAGGGIGRAIARKLAEQGCNLFLHTRTDNPAFSEEMAQLAAEYGVEITPVAFDLENEAAIRDGVRSIMKRTKQIHILINNAGLAHMALFEMTSMEEIRRIYQVNVFAPILLCQLFMRRMASLGEGNIIQIASTAAHETYIGNSIYGSSKAALCHFTQCAAAEAASRGIRINAIAPGLTDTRMSKVFEKDDPSLPLSRSAIKRKLLTDEIADAVIGLLSDNMRMINGQIIDVNGGAS